MYSVSFFQTLIQQNLGSVKHPRFALYHKNIKNIKIKGKVAYIKQHDCFLADALIKNFTILYIIKVCYISLLK